ncbi:MAG: phage tail protein [Chloroflexota bacterium]
MSQGTSFQPLTQSSPGLQMAGSTSMTTYFGLGTSDPGHTPLIHLKSNTDVLLSHVAGDYNRYPGETLVLYTRVVTRRAVAGLTIQISLPEGVKLNRYEAVTPAEMQMGQPQIGLNQATTQNDFPRLTRLDEPRQDTPDVQASDRQELILVRPEDQTSQLETSNKMSYLVWQVDESLPAGTILDYETELKVEPVVQDTYWRSEATVYEGADTGAVRTVDARQATEVLTIMIRTKGDYLQHLPALFERDDFMGRFLMLFESFWNPIERQIDDIDHYFDPKLTPSAFLPWLAYWFDLDLTGAYMNDFWPEYKQRRLLSSISRLYRKRGTRIGMEEFLEIFTEHPVEIIEHRSNNLVLGINARLGTGIAVGQSNHPHTFTVKVQVEPIPMTSLDGKPRSDKEMERLRQVEERYLRDIIDAEKPAHTWYTLEIERLDGEQ